MALRGERFHVDFSSDDEQLDDSTPPGSVPPVFDLVADIKERTPALPTPPTAPRSTSTPTGFPAPRRRNKQSAFKTQRAATEQHSLKTPNVPKSESVEQDEKKNIDEENKRRLASMSSGEIKNEQEELMSSLPASLLERLLKRATIDDEDQMSGLERDTQNTTPKSSGILSHDSTTKSTNAPKKSVSFDSPAPAPAQHAKVEPSKETEKNVSFDNNPPLQPPTDLHPASEPPNVRVHFPKPPPRQTPMPNLDPSSPSFLNDLQTHYFPDTPHDPSSLSWLKSPPPSSDSSAYNPESDATSVTPAALRFSLTGDLLAPRTSLSLPTTLGLHHHSADPEAAGYTIPELAILSRSTMPAQRCLAYQIIGRVLFKLGKGNFGKNDSALVKGLWSVVEREGVVVGMLVEAGGGDITDVKGFENINQGPGNVSSEDPAEDSNSASTGGPKAGGIGRHASAKAWATEAVWLWRRGGGGDKGLKRERPAT